MGSSRRSGRSSQRLVLEEARATSEVNHESLLSGIINRTSGFDAYSLEISCAEAAVLLRRQSSCMLNSSSPEHRALWHRGGSPLACLTLSRRRIEFSGPEATVLFARSALYCHAVWPRQTLQKPRSQSLLSAQRFVYGGKPTRSICSVMTDLGPELRSFTVNESANQVTS